MMFDLVRSKLILVSKINSVRNENFLLYVRITFKGTTKHESLILKTI